MSLLNNQLVLITGASSGIGAATAKELAQAGARPILIARNREALDRLASQLAIANYEVHTYACDLSDPHLVETVIAQIVSEVGLPDIIVNNAGAGAFRYTEETTPGQLLDMTAVPYFAAFYVTRALLPPLKQRGSGRIVNITSPASYLAWPGATAYTAARWALRGFTKALQVDLRGTGIDVSLVTLSKVRSGYWAHNPGSEERLPGIARLLPTLTPQQAAHGIRKAIESKASDYFYPVRLRLMYWAYYLFPPLMEWLIAKTGFKKS